MSFIPRETPSPITETVQNAGISAPAVRLGRLLDRKPDGEYIIIVHKTSSPHPWRVRVVEAVENAELGR